MVRAIVLFGGALLMLPIPVAAQEPPVNGFDPALMWARRAAEKLRWESSAPADRMNAAARRLAELSPSDSWDLLLAAYLMSKSDDKAGAVEVLSRSWKLATWDPDSLDKVKDQVCELTVKLEHADLVGQACRGHLLIEHPFAFQTFWLSQKTMAIKHEISVELWSYSNSRTLTELSKFNARLMSAIERLSAKSEDGSSPADLREWARARVEARKAILRAELAFAEQVAVKGGDRALIDFNRMLSLIEQDIDQHMAFSAPWRDLVPQLVMHLQQRGRHRDAIAVLSRARLHPMFDMYAESLAALGNLQDAIAKLDYHVSDGQTPVYKKIEYLITLSGWRQRQGDTAGSKRDASLATELYLSSGSAAVSRRSIAALEAFLASANRMEELSRVRKQSALLDPAKATEAVTGLARRASVAMPRLVSQVSNLSHRSSSVTSQGDELFATSHLNGGLALSEASSGRHLFRGADRLAEINLVLPAEGQQQVERLLLEVRARMVE